MFTGIIGGVGKLLEKRIAGGGVTFKIAAGFDLTDPCEGESVAINGVCLTAYDIHARDFLADVSPETLSRSTLGELVVGDTVNMERALRPTDRLGGHIVSGHVDCVAQVLEKRSVGDFTLFSFSLPERLGRYVIEKGSIAVDGISLTVNGCGESSFDVSIIPHTLGMTTLRRLQKGGRVNIEVDIIGKYVEKLVASGRSGSGNISEKGMDNEFLAKHGFF